MYSFCPHCGQTLEQDQAPGRLLVCRHCGTEIGPVPIAPAPVVAMDDDARQGQAARCSVCGETVQIQSSGAGSSIAPHYAPSAPRKICQGSGKSVATPPLPASEQKKPPGKDLSAYMTRDIFKVVLCKKVAPPTIEELTLEYLDKADRVRLQIDALRDILGPSFRLRDNPIGMANLSAWGNATACVIARADPQGGYQSLTDVDIKEILALLPEALPRLFS